MEIVKKNTVNTNILVFTTAELLLYSVVNTGRLVLCLFKLSDEVIQGTEGTATRSHFEIQLHLYIHAPVYLLIKK